MHWVHCLFSKQGFLEECKTLDTKIQRWQNRNAVKGIKCLRRHFSHNALKTTRSKNLKLWTMVRIHPSSHATWIGCSCRSNPVQPARRTLMRPCIDWAIAAWAASPACIEEHCRTFLLGSCWKGQTGAMQIVHNLTPSLPTLSSTPVILPQFCELHWFV